MLTIIFSIISYISAQVETGILPDGKKYYVFTGEEANIDSASEDVNIVEKSPGVYQVSHKKPSVTGEFDPVLVAAADNITPVEEKYQPPCNAGSVADAFRRKYNNRGPEAEKIATWLQGIDSWIDNNMEYTGHVPAPEYVNQIQQQYQEERPTIIGVADEKTSKEILQGRQASGLHEDKTKSGTNSKNEKDKSKSKKDDKDKDKDKDKKKSKAKNNASGIALTAALGILALASFIA
ncbi:hypothetical protein SLOPH_749 [Spraguea lophii 42_110]|uniref:Uncharacterized protein n=1 Tax=Spraguea lophii (strain 42_110) TaxID=1358809 RepID=S7W4Q0_SPRLO|nr:hypothetical protein SLOPH_749 [Spraguea lophii 42_110]